MVETARLHFRRASAASVTQLLSAMSDAWITSAIPVSASRDVQYVKKVKKAICKEHGERKKL
jgi:hypothetical protein